MTITSSLTRSTTGDVTAAVAVNAEVATTCIRRDTSAYVSIRQHVYVSMHTSGYVRIRQDTSGYVRIRQDTSTYVSRYGVGDGLHTSAYVSIRQLTSSSSSAAVTIRSFKYCDAHDKRHVPKGTWSAKIKMVGQDEVRCVCT
jgi:hypothetical protein